MNILLFLTLFTNFIHYSSSEETEYLFKETTPLFITNNNLITDENLITSSSMISSLVLR